MIELTDAKCDKIAAAAIARDYVTPPRGTPFDIAVIYRIIVRAGLAAGIERCSYPTSNRKQAEGNGMTALTDLRALALAATPGKWELEDFGAAGNGWCRQADVFENQPYIAALSPERVLVMIAVIEAAKALDHRSTREHSIALHAALAALEKEQK